MARRTISLLFVLLLAATSAGSDAVVGWRGNWTGLWPDAQPPLEWQRLPRGLATALRGQSTRPALGDETTAPLLDAGLLRDWLVLGPFAVQDSVKDFEQTHFPNEGEVQPTTGDRVGEQPWRPASIPATEPYTLGPAELPWLDLARAVGGFKINQVVYAHTYLHAPRLGQVRVVLEHAHGLQAWLNGQRVYREPDRKMVLSFWTNLSRFELEHRHPVSPSFTLNLKQGWNRLLVRSTSFNRPGWTDQRFTLRLQDPPGTEYDTKNIRWLTELPQRSSSTPIIVGERVFTMAEPDELFCLDKSTGRILWSASHSYHDALPEEKQQANPAYREKIEPLRLRLKQEKDFRQRVELRRQIQKELQAIDPEHFEAKGSDHYRGHFAIVGFTVPTPISDGKHIWVWCGNGVAACYNLAGQRRWITRLEAGELNYASTPTLVDGVFVAFLGRLYGLDAATGKLLWQQTRIHRNQASLLPARLAGVPVVVTQGGHVVRARDGKVLYRDRSEGPGDTGWAAPVILGQRIVQCCYGVTSLTVHDFSQATGEDWKPEVVARISLPGEVSRKPNGGWVDRWTAGSPLVHNGLIYQIDIYGELFVVDLQTKKMVYRQPTELRGLFHYNALPVAASITLIGKHLLVLDNQGNTLVLEPGRTFKQVVKNRIATQLVRDWPIPAQETLSYGPPVTDGERLYLRGERYLYCIGAK